MTRDEGYMLLALEEAKAALSAGEVPVGAVVVLGDRVIARCGNRRERDLRPTAHAELLAIEKAAEALHDWRLSDCELFVTLEPCPMCTGAIIASRVRRVVFGAFDPAYGCLGGAEDLSRLPNSGIEEIIGGVLDERCRELLDRFFKQKRG